MPNPRYLTVAQTAELLQVCRETVYKWIRNREIDYLKLPGASYRIPRDALEKRHPAENLLPSLRTEFDRTREMAARFRSKYGLQKKL
jgi:excisionase family DNA binding protein